MENEKPGFFAEIKEVVERYLHDKLLLIKLETSEKVAGFVSNIYIVLPVFFLLFMIAALATFLAGYYLSVLLGHYWAGFGIMLILYVILLFVLMNLHNKKLKKIVADKVVETIFKN
jgi:energy-coupling factor transporter transmembrane protein EcfT